MMKESSLLRVFMRAMVDRKAIGIMEVKGKHLKQTPKIKED